MTGYSPNTLNKSIARHSFNDFQFVCACVCVTKSIVDFSCLALSAADFSKTNVLYTFGQSHKLFRCGFMLNAISCCVWLNPLLSWLLCQYWLQLNKPRTSLSLYKKNCIKFWLVLLFEICSNKMFEQIFSFACASGNVLVDGCYKLQIAFLFFVFFVFSACSCSIFFVLIARWPERELVVFNFSVKGQIGQDRR